MERELFVYSPDPKSLKGGGALRWGGMDMVLREP